MEGKKSGNLLNSWHDGTVNEQQKYTSLEESSIFNENATKGITIMLKVHSLIPLEWNYVFESSFEHINFKRNHDAFYYYNSF